MQSNLSPEDWALLNKGLAAIGVSLSLQPSADSGNGVSCLFINNPDGTLRWLWPASARKPQFLRFYHQGSFRAKVFAGLCRTCFAVNGQRLVASGRITLYIQNASEHLAMSTADWSLFTGTVGANRKLVLWQQAGSGAGTFTKLPLTDAAARNITAEIKALHQEVPAQVTIPRLLGGPDLLIQEDIYAGRKNSTVAQADQLPAAALQSWLLRDLGKGAIGQQSWYRDLSDRCGQWKTDRDQRLSPSFFRKMEHLFSLFPEDAPVRTSTAHGDFTAWNVRKDGDRLLMIDWELSRQGMPVLYDLFHFIYQNNILIRRRPFKAIRSEIDSLLARPEWQEFLQRNQIDAAQAEQLYLLYTVSYYSDVYRRQEQWHLQVAWLLSTWEEAMSYWLQQSGKETMRSSVLSDIAHMLYDQPYAALKLATPDWAHLPATSDLDLCMPASTAQALTAYLQQHYAVARVRQYRQTFMNHLTVFLRDGSMIHIDCIRQIRRKALQFMDAAPVWENAAPNPYGIKIPAAADDLKYTWLFYLLNKAGVPGHYQQPYLSGPAASQAALQEVAGTLLGKYGHDTILQYDGNRHRKVVSLLSAQPANNGMRRLYNRVRYGIDVLHGLLPRKGCVVTFSGVDGAGKSTVIETTRKRIEKELRLPVVVLRHRPSLLPILSAWTKGKKAAEYKAATTLPRQGNNGSVLSSIFRFGYYFTDYLLGQFYIQCRYVWRGYVVMYDRYYFDFINDSKRSNIVLSSSFTSWWYRFLLKPECNFFLYAPAQVILARKQELDEASIVQLTDQYLNLFKRLGKGTQHRYIPVCNIQLDRTLDQVFQTIKKQRA